MPAKRRIGTFSRGAGARRRTPTSQGQQNKAVDLSGSETQNAKDKYPLDMDCDKLFVVAIDFGTAYSGYGFSSIHNKNQFYTFNWGNGHGNKTQTSILFTPEKNFHSFGYEAEEQYTVLLQQGLNSEWYFFKRFKMTLYENPNLNETSTIKDFTGKEFNGIDVFSEGIRYLKDHLFRHFQQHIPLELMDNDIHWVLTVPAIWNETAKKFMRKAAEKAGIHTNKLTLALEPESAALYCQLGRPVTGLRSMGCEEKFMLLDCGGGTIDTTVHQVGFDNSLKEIHRATGGPWGGMKVNDAFKEYLLNLKTIQNLPETAVIELERRFEKRKKTIGSGDTPFYMKLPASVCQALGPGLLVGGKLKITNKFIRAFFTKVVNDICKHIQNIISSIEDPDLKTIILVGGFAESLLLQEAIENRFPTINVRVPKDPSLAVIKGAVHFGHNPNGISIRISPYTYGIDIIERFRNGIHPISNLISRNGIEYCDHCFDIHVRKDQEVKTGTPISDGNYSPISNRNQSKMEIILVSSESQEPKYVTEYGSSVVGRFDIQLPEAPLDRSVNVRMIFSGTEIKVEARNSINRLPYTASFEIQ